MKCVNWNETTGEKKGKNKTKARKPDYRKCCAYFTSNRPGNVIKHNYNRKQDVQVQIHILCNRPVPSWLQTLQHLLAMWVALSAREITQKRLHLSGSKCTHWRAAQENRWFLNTILSVNNKCLLFLIHYLMSECFDFCCFLPLHFTQKRFQERTKRRCI